MPEPPATPEVVFYVLKQSLSRMQAACHIAACHSRAGTPLWLYTGSREEAEQVDSLLWTFEDISFVPHALAGDHEADTVHIVIGWPAGAPAPGGRILNLAHSVPDDISPGRIIELVLSRDDEKTAARNRFRQYRQNGLVPQHIDATDWDAVR